VTPRSLTALAVLALACCALRPLSAQGPAAPSGFYTDSQATRGQQWYEAVCAACHPSRDMSSNDFKLRWNGRSALDLYQRISTTMPANEPGALSARTYRDVVAYLMRINGLPTGTAALTADTVVMRQAPLVFAGLPTPSP
jgi:S-disulfanyl-L-cysteine oxidoreductase SoxD